MTWLCPACNAPLILTDRTLACENNHRYDIAKQGYVNLHLVQHKKSKQPGDDPQMVSARRTFLSQGYYQPLADKLSQVLEKHHTGAELSLFDAGCGEGYYLDAIMQNYANQDRFVYLSGIDISKAAVAKAAKRLSNGAFAVASTFSIPIPDMSQDAVIQIFAPSSAEEVQRILSVNGLWLLVQPAPHHLFELKQCVYDSPQLHSIDHESPDGFALVEEIQLTFTLDLTNDDVGKLALLQMTPFYWTISAEKQASLPEKLTQVTVDFHIKVLRKT